MEIATQGVQHQIFYDDRRRRLLRCSARRFSAPILLNSGRIVAPSADYLDVPLSERVNSRRSPPRHSGDRAVSAREGVRSPPCGPILGAAAQGPKSEAQEGPCPPWIFRLAAPRFCPSANAGTLKDIVENKGTVQGYRRPNRKTFCARWLHTDSCLLSPDSCFPTSGN